MKLSNKFWARFEAKGQPNLTRTINASGSAILLEFARFCADTTLNSKIVLTIARSEDMLNTANRSEGTDQKDAIVDELSKMLDAAMQAEFEEEPS